MERKLFEVAPPHVPRTEWGRVIVNPPKIAGTLKYRETGKILWCCNRAYLTKESYDKHLAEKDEHSHAVDYERLPRTDITEEMEHAIHDRSSTEFWMVRKGYSNTINGKIPKEQSSSATRGTTYTCPICNMKVHICNKRRHHERNHAENGKFNCPKCPCTFLLDSQLKRHLATIHRSESHSGFSTSFKNALVAKAKKQLTSIPHKFDPRVEAQKGKQGLKTCPICGRQFSSYMRLRDHMNTHSGARPYSCDICQLSFAHLSNVRRHKRVAHTSNDSFSCEICDCTFSSNLHLVRHNKAVHDDIEDHPVKNDAPQKELDSPKLQRYNYNSMQNNDSKMRSNSPSTNENVSLPHLTLQHPGQNTNGFYECPVCHKELSTPQTWKGHMLIHQNSKPYKCNLCGQSFRLCSTRSAHVKKCHDGPIHCKYCPCHFRVQLALLRHMRLIHPNLNLNQRLKNVLNINGKAGMVSNSRTELDLEATPHYKCQLCGKYFVNLEDYEGHQDAHKNPRSNECNMCLKPFNNKNNIAHHKRMCHGDGENKCNFCCGRYATTAGLFRHLFTEHGMQRADWNFSAKAIRPQALKRLMMERFQMDVGDKMPNVGGGNAEDSNVIIKEDKPKIIKCKICPAKLTSMDTLKSHMLKSHDNDGQFKCEKCPSRFMQPQGLTVHKTLYHGHIGIKRMKKILAGKLRRPANLGLNFGYGTVNKRGLRYLCTYCNKTFASQRTLRWHMDQHKHGRTFKCDECPMSFGSAPVLRNHKKRSHAADAQFQCPLCPCKFMSNAGLINHKNMHEKLDREQEENVDGDIGGVLDQEESTEEVENNREQEQEFPVSGHFDSVEASMVVANDEVSSQPKASCPICNQIVGKYYLANHMKVHENPSRELKYECELCHLKFSNAESIPMHKKLNHFHDGQFKCTKCTCKFKSDMGLKYHITKHHKPKKHPQTVKPKPPVPQIPDLLPLSSLSFVQQLVEEPEATAAPAELNKYQCPKCFKQLSSKFGLDMHIQIHTRSEGEMRFTCDLCNLKFLHPGSIENHKKRSHYHQGKFHCTECTCKFMSEGGLINHRARYHDLKVTVMNDSERKDKFQCTFCDKILSRKYFNAHMAIHTRGEAEKKTYNCDLCSMTFTQPDLIKSHKQECHPKNGLHQCNLCPCKFQTASGLECHLKRYHGQSNDASKLQQDMQRVQEQLSFQEDHENVPSPPISAPKENSERPSTICDLCNLPVSFGTKLRQHKISSHVEGGQFKCLHCTCQFNTLRGRVRHMFYYHSKKPMITLRQFPEDSESEFKLLRPIKIKMPASSIASTVVRAQKVLKNSFKRNTGGRSKCPICGWLFFKMSYLTQHIKRAHSNGQFRCMLCVCSFHTKYGLAGHMKSRHLNPGAEEDYEPEPKIQLAKSTPYRPVKCHLCGCTFSSMSNQRQHMASAHTNGPYKCSMCCCRFLTNASRSLHMRSHSKPGYGGGLDEFSSGNSFGEEQVSRNDGDEWNEAEEVSNGYFRTDTLEERKPTPSKAKLGGSYQGVTCNLCGLFLSRKHYLEKHKQVAHTNGRYQCSKCNCSFHQVVGLTQHKLVHLSVTTEGIIPNGNEKTGEDKDISESPRSTVNHNFLKIRASGRMSPMKQLQSLNRTTLKPIKYPFTCNLCGQKFSKKRYFRRHQLRAHVAGGKCPCTECICVFTNAIQLAAHKRICHSKTLGTDSEIEGNVKTFITEAEERPSIQQHSSLIKSPSNKNFRYVSTCKLCGLRFTNKVYFLRHQRKAHILGGLSCDVCHCSFSSPYELGAHKRSYHTQGGGFKPKLKPILNHVKRPTVGMPAKEGMGKRPFRFKCNLCGVKFSQVKYFNNHERTAHTGGPHRCEHCTCSFDNLGKLSAHLRVYHLDKLSYESQSPARMPVSPVQNLKKFPEPSEVSETLTRSRSRSKTPDLSLKSHSPVASLSSFIGPISGRTGSGFKCSLCPKRFGNEKRLMRHKLRHTRPEHCNMCNRRFPTKDELSRHIDNSHLEGDFQCFTCSCRFNTQVGLRQHEVKMHKNTKDSKWDHDSAINQFVIENEQENYPEDEEDSFLRLDSTYSQQQQQPNELDGAIDDMEFEGEESEPIIQSVVGQYPGSGRTETSNGTEFSNGFEPENEEEEAEMDVDLEGQDNDNFIEGENESEPIIQGILEYGRSHESHSVEEGDVFRKPRTPSPPPSLDKPPPVKVVAKKKTFSPKDRPMKCPECGVTCRGPENLRKHQESHKVDLGGNQDSEVGSTTTEEGKETEKIAEEIDLKCKSCGVTLSSKEEFQDHMELEHDETGLYRCVYCPCTMKTESNLRFHFMKYHSGK